MLSGAFLKLSSSAVANYDPITEYTSIIASNPIINAPDQNTKGETYMYWMSY